jgi:hypothetical protein
LSDGRFAVFGGHDGDGNSTASCEALSLEGNERWEPLPPMLEARARGFVCAAVGGCVIVGGGVNSLTMEVYQEGRGRWRRLPCNLPHDGGSLIFSGSALM